MIAQPPSGPQRERAERSMQRRIALRVSRKIKLSQSVRDQVRGGKNSLRYPTFHEIYIYIKLVNLPPYQ
jgi:hypothetical protein